MNYGQARNWYPPFVTLMSSLSPDSGVKQYLMADSSSFTAAIWDTAANPPDQTYDNGDGFKTWCNAVVQEAYAQGSKDSSLYTCKVLLSAMGGVSYADDTSTPLPDPLPTTGDGGTWDAFTAGLKKLLGELETAGKWGIALVVAGAAAYIYYDKRGK